MRKKIRIYNLAIAFLFFVFLFKVNYSFSQKSNYVIVVGIDGLSSWGLKKYSHPTLDSLMGSGVYSLSAKAVVPTLSAPNWATILTGVKPGVHRIKSNGWKKYNGHLYVPTIFGKIYKLDSNLNQAVIYQWKEFEQLIEDDPYVFKYYCTNEKMVFDKASEKLMGGETQLIFMHIDNVDSSGHKFGQRSQEYKYAINRVDSLIGTLVNQIKMNSNDNNIYLVITSDHGFWGKHHGGLSRKEKNIPWIIAGPNVKEGYVLKSKINTQDTNSLIYYLLSTQMENDKTEKLIKEIFK